MKREDLADLMNRQEDLADLMNRQEDLIPDLQQHIYQDSFGKCLKHPLVFGIPYFPQMNAFYNAQYRHKADMIMRMLAEKQWDSYIFLHERPYRLEAFVDKMYQMDDKEYWRLLATIWADSENLWQYQGLLKTLLQSSRPGRENMMSEEEKEFFNKLPDEVVIYRGHRYKNRYGFSWTLSFWQAHWFAQRYNAKPAKGAIISGICKKENIHAVLLGRKEFEVIISPESVQIKLVRKLNRRGWLREIYNEALSNYTLNWKSYHGMWHWDKVERNAIALCREVKGADKLVCRLFAILHDCKRVNEQDDPEHGQRAAEFVAGSSILKQNLTKEQLDKLVYACHHHNAGVVSSDPTIGVCWDADRLDLSRVGITPCPNRLSTKAAKNNIWRI